MAAFTNQPIKSTYGDIVQLGNSGAGVSASLLTVQDGLGNNLPYQLSSTAFNVTGTFTVSSSIVLTASNTATLTNKVYDTAGAGNVFKINGTQVSAVTGTGLVVLATSPTLVTPALGTPTSGNLANCTFPTLNQNTTGNAATVTTNANLTGPITSVGNATSVAAQTGTGSTFVMQASPTITTPIIAQINDTNSNKIIVNTPTASAVNYVNITNNSTTNAPIVAAAGTDTNVALKLSGQGTSGVIVEGFTDGSSAAAGTVGELISNTASGVNLSSSTATTITSITLTPGDWDLYGSISADTGGNVTLTNMVSSLSKTNNTTGSPTSISESYQQLPSPFNASASAVLTAGCCTARVSTNTTYYLVGFVVFTGGGTTSCGGVMWARRRR